jgi:UDP-N-acetylmuramyl pentapeptide phosphotransferase/UDP-N-acetylglucosamine-1-phosphate transferase
VIDSLRKVLADSHVAPIAIALLMAWSLIDGIDGLAPPVFYAILCAVLFVITAVTEREMPYSPFRLHGYDFLVLSQCLPHLLNAVTYAAAAWLLSQWVYGQGPIRSLRTAWSEIIRRSDVSST